MALLERLIGSNLEEQFSPMPRFAIEKFQKNLGSFKIDFFRDGTIKFAKIVGTLLTSGIR